MVNENEKDIIDEKTDKKDETAPKETVKEEKPKKAAAKTPKESKDSKDSKAAAPKSKKAAAKESAEKETVARVPARLGVQFKTQIAPELMKRFNYKSVMQIPKLEKVVVNVGCGDAKENAKVIDSVIKDLSIITGQQAVATTAKHSVANFKLREGTKVGVKVTLRGEIMYEFLDRLFNLALPRQRDFRGINVNAFDGRGNYALGIREQLIFPEIEYDKIDKIRGMDIVIVTTAKTDEEARELLTLMGAPFAKT